jgi:glycosyltransferase involved in cell wall biosynthesis
MSVDDHSLQPRKKKMISQLCRLSYPLADHVVAVSQAVAADTASYLKFPRERINVIYNPAVTPELIQGHYQVPEHAFFKPKSAAVMVSVGRLTEQKDFFSLLRAFALLRQKQDAKLIILGEGEDRPALERLARELNLGDDLSMPGFLQNPYDFMKHADLLVSSSAWEGLPTVLIEALALGTPVVATDCPGGSREILQAGAYGKLVPVHDPAALAEAMQAALSHPPERNKLQQRGRDFSLEAAARAYLELI